MRDFLPETEGDHVERAILRVADLRRPFISQTDASNFGLGAVLSQLGEDDSEHSVAYTSSKCLPREVYSVVEKSVLLLCGHCDSSTCSTSVNSAIVVGKDENSMPAELRVSHYPAVQILDEVLER